MEEYHPIPVEIPEFRKTVADMYEFLIGPLLWFTGSVSVAGCVWKFFRAARLAKQDRVVFPRMGLPKSVGSFSRWVAPYVRLNVRVRPVLTIVTIVFHFCLIVTPVLLLSHIELWHQGWNVRWWSLPERAADIMTMAVILSCLFFLLRRMMLSDVNQVTGWRDYVLLAITAAPFITGFMAFHQWLDYHTMLIIHILSGHLMLLAIPFTRLGHMIFFYFSRGYTGSEYGREANPRFG